MTQTNLSMNQKQNKGHRELWLAAGGCQRENTVMQLYLNKRIH